MATIDILITRHGEKAAEPKSAYAGDPVDCALPLSEKGVRESFQTGASILSPSYDLVIGRVSRHTRTHLTLAHMLRGAGYQVNEDGVIGDARVVVEQKNDLGLHGYNWRVPGAPDFKTDPEGYSRFMLKHHFLPRAGKQPLHPVNWPVPVLAQLAYNLAHAVHDSLYQAEQKVKREGHQRILVAVVTHAPYLDGLSNALLQGNIQPQLDGSTVLEGYIGPFNMGDYISGTLTSNGAQGSEYTGTLSMKGRELKITDNCFMVAMDVLRAYLTLPKR